MCHANTQKTPEKSVKDHIFLHTIWGLYTWGIYTNHSAEVYLEVFRNSAMNAYEIIDPYQVVMLGTVLYM